MRKVFSKVLLLIIPLLPLTAMAEEILMGRINLNVGDEERLTVDPSGEIIVTGTWAKTGNAVVITASSFSDRSCVVRAINPGESKVTWNGYMMGSKCDFYWLINVESSSNPDNPNNPDDNPNNLDRAEDLGVSWTDAGNYSIGWYNKNLTEYTLSTNKELAGMAVIINNGYSDFEGKTIKLGADIDLSGKNWTPCGTFKGTFDGMEHTISGINISIVSEDTQKEFGFWRRFENAHIRNLIMEGIASVEIKNHESGLVDTYFGGMVGYCDGLGSIENCEVIMDVYFNRHEVYSLSSGAPAQWSYIGGIVGWNGFSNSPIRYCKHIGNLTCELSEWFTVQAIAVGGIAGRGDNVQFCENVSDEIYLKDYMRSNIFYRYLGGICGISNNYDSSKSILCCRSIVDRINIKQVSKPTTRISALYHLGGIVPIRSHWEDNVSGFNKGTINCYSSISNIVFDAKNQDAELYYGGIGSDEPKSKACFSNNDVKIDIPIEGYHAMGHLYDGSTSFSLNQMQTPAFLEELNMYSMLEMDGPVWAQDADGGYPYIAALYEASGVTPVLTDGKDRDYPVFSLSGQRLAAPQKGINIVGGRKVVVK